MPTSFHPARWAFSWAAFLHDVFMPWRENVQKPSRDTHEFHSLLLHRFGRSHGSGRFAWSLPGHSQANFPNKPMHTVVNWEKDKQRR
jgi:hypothetical protein